MQGKPLVQQIPRRLLSFLRDLELDSLDDDREDEHEYAHEQEEAIADRVGQKDLVRHRDVRNSVVGRVGSDFDDNQITLPRRPFSFPCPYTIQYTST